MMKYLNLGWERRIQYGRAVVYEFVDQLLARRAASGHDHEILWSILVLERESGREVSHNTIRSSMVSLIMAGKDTVSAGLTYFFWLLARHPRVEAKILAELRGILNSDHDDPRAFTFEELKAMDYLHAALSESLRLYPPIPRGGNGSRRRRCSARWNARGEGCTGLLSDLLVRKEWRACGAKDCLEFKPERWLKNGRFVRESDFKFAAFNAGPRRCTGREFAYWQMKWVAASIISRYQ
ncbi:hypothetical protein KI387_027829, partial [Taxus chinensis]